MFKKLTRVFVALLAIASLTHCAAYYNIKEVKPGAEKIVDATESDVKGCKLLGSVGASDSAGYDSLIAGKDVARKSAKAAALNDAFDLGATSVVWSQEGVDMVHQWIGKAYRCRK